jgi:predicted membrane chloride channel (bestrophin family)
MIERLVLMIFCTCGFLGLEYVNMEMDDPYGTDPNDFPSQ